MIDAFAVCLMAAPASTTTSSSTFTPAEMVSLQECRHESATQALASGDVIAAARLLEDALDVLGQARASGCRDAVWSQCHLLHSKASAVCLLLRDAEGALSHANECVRLAPHRAQGHQLRGLTLMELGRIPPAAAALQIASEADPQNEEIRKTLDRVSACLDPKEIRGRRIEDGDVVIVLSECVACRKKLRKEDYVKCRCGAIAYCSPACRRVYIKKEHTSYQCSVFAYQMKRHAEMATFPFLFSADTTLGILAGTVDWHAFLEDWGVSQVGLWRRECGCLSVVPFGAWRQTPGCDIFALPSSWIPPEQPCAKDVAIRDWESYYVARKLPFASLAALLLHSPLTVYHVLHNILSVSSTCDELRIHILGVEKEADQEILWKELVFLFPGRHILLDFIGAQLSTDISDKEATVFEECNGSGRICIRYHVGTYHEVLPRLLSPHAAIALNGGIEVYPSWRTTLLFLASLPRHPPFFVTEYTEFGAERDAEVIERCGMDVTHSPSPNPFRQPRFRRDTAVLLPTYANGFILGSVFKE